MAFDVNEFKQEAMKEIMDQVDEELDDIVDDIYAKSQELLDLMKPRVSRTGRAYSSQTTDTGALAGHSRVVKEYLKKTIMYWEPYAAAIAFGTRPHYPPLEPLARWAHRKLRVKPSKEMEVARRIAWKIYRYGTEPQPFLRPPLNEYVARGILEYNLLNMPFGVDIRL